MTLGGVLFLTYYRKCCHSLSAVTFNSRACYDLLDLELHVQLISLLLFCDVILSWLNLKAKGTQAGLWLGKRLVSLSYGGRFISFSDHESQTIHVSCPSWSVFCRNFEALDVFPIYVFLMKTRPIEPWAEKLGNQHHQSCPLQGGALCYPKLVNINISSGQSSVEIHTPLQTDPKSALKNPKSWHISLEFKEGKRNSNYWEVTGKPLLRTTSCIIPKRAPW